MTSGQQDDQTATEYGFPVVRRGYDRAAVDEFARSAHTEITELRRSYETLAAHYAQLQAAPAETPTADYSGLGGRAQEILRIAEEQARDLTSRSSTDADRLREQTEHDVRVLRDRAAAELQELRSTETARLDALGHRTEREAAVLLSSARSESAQVLGATRLEAEAVRAEAEHHARSVVEGAQLQAAAVFAEAEQAALALRQQAADHREQVLRELQNEAADLRARIGQTMADSSRLHRESAEHLSAEADEAARSRATALAEVEQIRLAALAEAEEVLGRARQQAATLEERSRQEFVWRRRQLRQEQDLLTRRKQAMLSQLASLSALAVETAESMPEVPELDLGDPDPDLDEGATGDGAEAAEDGPPAVTTDEEAVEPDVDQQPDALPASPETHGGA